MEKPIGIVAKQTSMDLENIIRKHYGDKYIYISDNLRISLYQTLIMLFKNENISEKKQNHFIHKYQKYDGKSIDEILQTDDGSKVMENLKSDLQQIIKTKNLNQSKLCVVFLLCMILIGVTGCGSSDTKSDRYSYYDTPDGRRIWMEK